MLVHVHRSKEENDNMCVVVYEYGRVVKMVYRQHVFIDYNTIHGDVEMLVDAKVVRITQKSIEIYVYENPFGED